MSAQALPSLAVLAMNIGGWLLVHLGVSYLHTSLPQRWFAGLGSGAGTAAGAGAGAGAGGTVRKAERSKEKQHFGRGAEPKQRDKSGEERFYEQVLFIRSWKDSVPDGSFLFRRGFQKKRLAKRGQAYYQEYMVETLRGEWTHWLSIVPAPLFFIWNEPLYGYLMVGYALAANLPFIAILRYNRLRLRRICGSSRL
ncbi:hypothetical protein BBD42_28445 [Paenibacillus sp. BIHB 4019]|uniref:Glycosyl-4,4'-diaponeurosporenoate acyltransferase n=1 Tax=Paenibacillus sp. BIHB 4019 TaxID=1870819 RepID=A0A1B2DQJ6_9BACL|nr:hypothetical protein [Paenibacillus sp. BIHB 4019]ANY69994.1 hypothetical protein BBD42_28445 [Paenibacillus sp. BIHB 4019]